MASPVPVGWMRVPLMALPWFFALVTFAYAAEDAPGIRARLVQVSVLRGSFEQEKQISGFRNPLRSSGDFLLARGKGLVWNTRHPFASTLVLTSRGMRTGPAGSSEKPAGPGRLSGAGVGMANELLVALLGGDVASLSGQFRMVESVSPDGSWRLQLVPRRGPLTKVFKQIELRGDRFVRSVRLLEPGGDVTQLAFVQLRETPTTLSADEARQLGQ